MEESSDARGGSWGPLDLVWEPMGQSASFFYIGMLMQFHLSLSPFHGSIEYICTVWCPWSFLYKINTYQFNWKYWITEWLKKKKESYSKTEMKIQFKKHNFLYSRYVTSIVNSVYLWLIDNFL